MKTFIFCLADTSYYKKNMFSSDEVILSPDIISPDNKNSFRIPAGSPHIVEIFDQYPSLPRNPDFIIIKTDALQKNFVRGLTTLDCPSVVSVADTHHLHRPIEAVKQYLEQENFDFISFENDRHHLKWFESFGTQKLGWYPNLFLSPINIPPCTLEHKRYKTTFVGSTGKFHPFRSLVVDQLRQRLEGFNYGSTETRQQASEIYNQSLISLNISLNGDLNWRVFEIIASGGFLLTDRLPSDSGINLLFQEGIHYEAFSDEQELFDKIQYYQSNPEKATELANNSYNEYWKNYSQKSLVKDLIKESFLDEINHLQLPGEKIPSSM